MRTLTKLKGINFFFPFEQIKQTHNTHLSLRFIFRDLDSQLFVVYFFTVTLFLSLSSLSSRIPLFYPRQLLPLLSDLSLFPSDWFRRQDRVYDADGHGQGKGRRRRSDGQQKRIHRDQ
jgi:hypothetical protein